jgi:tRNA(fMet)-specific endonuclease VapC
MPLYMLDTNAASAVIKGHEQAEKRLRELPMDGWCISAVTRSELRFGLELKPQATRLAQIVNTWLELAPVAPWDKSAADAHGHLRARLHLAGTTIGAFDEMIAAHALALEAVVVTNNVKHFSRAEGLIIEDWLKS